MSFFFGSYCENLKGDICSSIEIMQFTGLKDKNGKEIYEGDIIKQDKEVWEVKYVPTCFNICELYSEEMEVIGNIYENPELLSKAN